MRYKPGSLNPYYGMRVGSIPGGGEILDQVYGIGAKPASEEFG